MFRSTPGFGHRTEFEFGTTLSLKDLVAAVHHTQLTIQLNIHRPCPYTILTRVQSNSYEGLGNTASPITSSARVPRAARSHLNRSISYVLVWLLIKFTRMVLLCLGNLLFSLSAVLTFMMYFASVGDVKVQAHAQRLVIDSK